MKISQYLKKTARFIGIYGALRTYVKVVGRSRALSKVGFIFSFFGEKNIGLIGSGQFGFSTIGYFISRYSKGRFAIVFDISSLNQSSFEQFYKCRKATDFTDVILDPAVEFVYVASNHASHTEYAIAALNAGKITYVEKPVSVSIGQLARLHKAVLKRPGRIYCGYNRPHSQAIKILKKQNINFSKPISLSFFISGHVLDDDHWYRNPAEGTRICGNVGHWLDLSVHLLSWGELPDLWSINITPSCRAHRDEDVAINLTSDRGDLINIVLTARTEPFEGINESINLQWDNLIAKIDDFRMLKFWQDEKIVKKRFWPKDVGHKKAILQPFEDDSRDWKEVELSSLLMLHIKDMVQNGTNYSKFSFSENYKFLEK